MTEKTCKVGDVRRWAEVPDRALVRDGEGAFAYRKGDRGVYAYVFGEDWLPANPWGDAGKWRWASCDQTAEVTIIALDVPADATAEHLRDLAERFAVRECLHAAPGLPGFWRVGLNSDVPGGEMMLGGFSGSADDAMQFWAERLHAARWRPGMSAEDAARLLSEAR